jgi:hypothetical protein
VRLHRHYATDAPLTCADATMITKPNVVPGKAADAVDTNMTFALARSYGQIDALAVSKVVKVLLRRGPFKSAITAHNRQHGQGHR